MAYARKQEKPIITQCEICGAALSPDKHGRAKHYCSDKCRKEAQRRRERGNQGLREATAEMQLQQCLARLPAQVAAKINEIKDTYGMFAASLAVDALEEMITYQNVTANRDKVTREADEYQFDVSVQRFKVWLTHRAKRGKRDGIDSFAKRLIADSMVPGQGSRSTYEAHIRSKGYAAEDITIFLLAWQEMRAEALDSE